MDNPGRQGRLGCRHGSPGLRACIDQDIRCAAAREVRDDDQRADRRTPWRRPGQASATRADPGSITTAVRCCTCWSCSFAHPRHSWLWVPAFAGTTSTKQSSHQPRPESCRAINCSARACNNGAATVLISDGDSVSEPAPGTMEHRPRSASQRARMLQSLN